MLPVTFTEENYLKAIYSIQHRTGSEVSVNEIAERMLTRPATVTDMLRKLSDKQLIHYEKYKKVQLTDAGQKTALTVLRKHRLWETFLYRKLNFSWDEVHVVAEQLEHIQSPKLIERLDEFLGYPEFDPHGDPIPKSNGDIPESVSIPLSEATIGKQYKIVAVRDTTSAFLQQLERYTIRIGTKINLLERLPYDNSILVNTPEEKNLQLSEKIAVNLLVV
jgi:DtxR family Mn-dependent transcriptional regulator